MRFDRLFDVSVLVGILSHASFRQESKRIGVEDEGEVKNHDCPVSRIGDWHRRGPHRIG